MSESKSTDTQTKPSTTEARRTRNDGFSEEERAAMRERTREMKRDARGKNEDGESEVLAKIAEMPEPDRSLAERIHNLIRANAPQLAPRTWYGMPAYTKDGNVLCFFQNAAKFKARYSTLGFSDKAHLDDGNMWPSSYALTALTPGDEARIVALLKQAIS